MSTATIAKPVVGVVPSSTLIESAKKNSKDDIDARIEAAMDRFEKTGLARTNELPVAAFASVKFKSDVKLSKDWVNHIDAKNLGEVTGKNAAKGGIKSILVTGQCSVKLRQDGAVSISASASKDVAFPEEVREEIAGLFATQIDYKNL